MVSAQWLWLIVANALVAGVLGDASGSGETTTTRSGEALNLKNCSSHISDEDDEEEYIVGGHWIAGDLSWAMAGVSTWLAIIVSCRAIYLHLIYYHKPTEQKWIVRILFMVPIYSICSWLSLKYYHSAVYIDGVRNVYEALVIYYFLTLCYQYLGGESAILAKLGQDAENKPRCVTCTCCLDPFPYDLNFLRYCKQGCLQFCIVKPVMSIIAMATHATGHFEEGDTSATGAYLWVSLTYNISITIALFSLVLFYAATREILAPNRPVLKFFVVKAVIFFAFWQSMVLSFGEKLGYVGGNYCDISAAQIALCWQSFLICHEMLLASIGMYYAFTHTIYMVPEGAAEGEVGNTKNAFKENLRKVISPRDIITDTYRNFSNKYGKYAAQGDDDNIGFIDDEDDKGVVEGSLVDLDVGGDISSMSAGPVPHGGLMVPNSNAFTADVAADPFGAGPATPMKASILTSDSVA